MQVILEVCDVCGKKHGIMLKRDGVVFGDRQCFLDFCNSVWLRWERDEFSARGIVPRKVVEQPAEELQEVEENLLEEAKHNFSGKIVNR